jgi:hypothetical protein
MTCTEASEARLLLIVAVALSTGPIDVWPFPAVRTKTSSTGAFAAAGEYTNNGSTLPKTTVRVSGTTPITCAGVCASPSRMIFPRASSPGTGVVRWIR